MPWDEWGKGAYCQLSPAFFVIRGKDVPKNCVLAIFVNRGYIVKCLTAVAYEEPIHTVYQRTQMVPPHCNNYLLRPLHLLATPLRRRRDDNPISPVPNYRPYHSSITSTHCTIPSLRERLEHYCRLQYLPGTVYSSVPYDVRITKDALMHS